ncbi:MAG: hypothetical protein AAF581_08125 [Planctomycetota bacterium]
MTRIHRLTFVALTVAAIVGIPRNSDAQPRVAIVAAASATATDCRFTDTQAKLQSTGLFSQVDIIATSVVTPTLQTLANYDACLCWTNTDALDAAAWGDVMADYVDAGGGVVVAVFANSTTGAARRLGGRWQNQPGYEVIVPASGSTTGAATLGTVLVPTHPVMSGIGTIDGGTSSFRPTVSAVTTGSTIIAQWSDGRILVAEGANPRRIDLGMYPPSSDCSGSFWNPASDGALLMANALLQTINTTPPEMLIRGECNNDGSFNLTDAVFLLTYLFPVGPPVTLSCVDACDANDDGSLNLPDAIALLNALFGQPPVPIAGPSTCGEDLTPDSFDCASLTACP